MDECIKRETAIELLSQPITMSMCLSVDECHHKIAQQRIDRYLIENIPAADVLPRDEWIKLGAELAAMHEATPDQQQLEEAYLKGVEYGMTRRDVRPVVTCGECVHRHDRNMHSCQGRRADFFCADGVKRETDGEEARRIKKQLALNGLGYPYDFPKRDES